MIYPKLYTYPIAVPDKNNNFLTSMLIVSPMHAMILPRQQRKATGHMSLLGGSTWFTTERAEVLRQMQKQLVKYGVKLLFH